MSAYTNLTIQQKYSDEDEVFIASGTSQEEKDLRRAMIATVIDTNGKAALITPGIGKQYIPREAYFQIFCTKPDDSINKDQVNTAYGSSRFDASKLNSTEVIAAADEKIPANKNKFKLSSYELAVTAYLNWVALGKTKGALAGTGVRMTILQEIDDKRECTIRSKLTDEEVKGLKEYITFLDANQELYAFWAANTNNVLAIAAACFLKEGHHFDSRNNRPQKAMLAALDQKDVFSEEDIRRVFYLAIHPYPMKNLMQYVSYTNGFKGINEAGRCRLRGAPSGTAQHLVIATAVDNVRGETFMKYASHTFSDALNQIQRVKTKVIEDPLPYHVNSSLITDKPHKTVEQNDPNTAAFLSAYIQVCVKGSLANAASLKKIDDANGRLVQKYKTALSGWIEAKGDDLLTMISNDRTSLKKLTKAEDDEDKLSTAILQKKINALSGDFHEPDS